MTAFIEFMKTISIVKKKARIVRKISVNVKNKTILVGIARNEL